MVLDKKNDPEKTEEPGKAERYDKQIGPIPLQEKKFPQLLTVTLVYFSPCMKMEWYF